MIKVFKLQQLLIIFLSYSLLTELLCNGYYSFFIIFITVIQCLVLADLDIKNVPIRSILLTKAS